MGVLASLIPHCTSTFESFWIFLRCKSLVKPETQRRSFQNALIGSLGSTGQSWGVNKHGAWFLPWKHLTPGSGKPVPFCTKKHPQNVEISVSSTHLRSVSKSYETIQTTRWFQTITKQLDSKWLKNLRWYDVKLGYYVLPFACGLWRSSCGFV